MEKDKGKKYHELDLPSWVQDGKSCKTCTHIALAGNQKSTLCRVQINSFPIITTAAPGGPGQVKTVATNWLKCVVAWLFRPSLFHQSENSSFSSIRSVRRAPKASRKEPRSHDYKSGRFTPFSHCSSPRMFQLCPVSYPEPCAICAG